MVFGNVFNSLIVGFWDLFSRTIWLIDCWLFFKFAVLVFPHRVALHHSYQTIHPLCVTVMIVINASPFPPFCRMTAGMSVFHFSPHLIFLHLITWCANAVKRRRKKNKQEDSSPSQMSRAKVLSPFFYFTFVAR